MAALREEGLIQFVAVTKGGGSQIILGYKDTRELAPTGKIAEPDQWYKMPLAPIAVNGTNGTKIQMVMKSEATDILANASSIVKIPAVVNGILTTLGLDDFQMNTGQKFATPSVDANTDRIIGELKPDAGEVIQLGGAKAWIEPYDDTV